MNTFRLRPQKGISLVEVMVALTLSLLLMAGVGQIYLSSRQTYRMQEAQSRMQENARYALDVLTRDIRMAGFMGCIGRVASINNTLDGPPPSFDPGDGIQGWEASGTGYGTAVTLAVNAAPVTVAIGTTSGTWSAAGGNTLDTTTAVPNSDIVRIWRGGDNPATISSITPGANTVVRTPTSPDPGTEDGDILLISDCQGADWIQACNVQRTTGGTEINHVLPGGCTPGNIASLRLTTKAGGELVKLVSNIYYVGKRGNTATNEPALFRRPLTNTAVAGTPVEVVEGIENMQILYGEDTDGDNSPNQYRTAANVTDWRRVISVRVSILVRSAENNLTTALQSFQFNGVATTAPDRRLRHVYTSTIGIRNRLQ